MRGKVKRSLVKRSRVRITPAYAGKRIFYHRHKWRRWDHPRLCGEKMRNAAPRFRPAGSPPPMRGKGVATAAVVLFTRITPAYAGKRLLVYTPKTPYVGSPPPMRGKDQKQLSINANVRITPAYAGKSYPEPSQRW